MTSFENIKKFTVKYKNVLIFLAGFLFDAITIDRIDASADIIIQMVYMTLLTGLLILQVRGHENLWTPPRILKKVWSYNVEALHFLYGGLLSAYVILYFRSSSAGRTMVFFVFLGALLILNEMPQIRKVAHEIRLALYSFCVCSFLIYLIPIIIGRMGNAIFIFSVFISAVIVWFVSGFLVSSGSDKTERQIRLFWPAAAFFIAIVVLYSFQLIPPVPLSVQYQGIFHKVSIENRTYTLQYLKPPFYTFWKRDSLPFIFSPGDPVYYFVRVFAPSRFKHTALIRWSFYDEQKKEYLESDRVPLEITGGRDQGFRGFVAKNRYKPGKWRVTTETSDGRIMGALNFEIREDKNPNARVWATRAM